VHDTALVSKSDFPSRADFDDAIEHLARRVRQPGELYWRAYARAFESPEGTALYAARETRPPDLPAPAAPEEEPVKKAEREITRLTQRYADRHPGVSAEQAIIKVLEHEPWLYEQYLEECGP
jgi:hypothetical protein